MEAFWSETGPYVGYVNLTSALDSQSGVGILSLGAVVFVLTDFGGVEVFESRIYLVFIERIIFRRGFGFDFGFLVDGFEEVFLIG